MVRVPAMQQLPLVCREGGSSGRGDDSTAQKNPNVRVPVSKGGDASDRTEMRRRSQELWKLV